MRNIFLIVVLITLVNCADQVEQTAQNTDYENNISAKLKVSILSYFDYEGTKVHDFYLHNNNGDSIKFSNFIGDSTVLCFYIPLNYCMDCINKQFEILASTGDPIVKDHTIIISTNPNYRTIFTLLKKFKLNLPVFTLNNNPIFFEEYTYSGPFFFLFNQNRTPWMHYAPIAEIEEINEKYFKAISRNLQNL